MNNFTFEIRGEHTLSVDDIWPGGGAPENPKLSDVLSVIRGEGSSASRLARDWNLGIDLYVNGELALSDL